VSYQQINLYQPILRKQQKIFSAVTMVQGAALVLVGLLLFFAFASWQSRAIAAQYAQLETRRAEALKRIAQMHSMFPEKAKDTALQEEVARLRKELEGRQQIAARLDATDAGNLEGFASHLEGLARQKPANLWLTDISVSRGGAELELRGSSFQPEQVPRYLQRLAEEPAFTGREFSDLQIFQPEKRPGRYDFVVSTMAQEKAAEEPKP
jgi:Tfp pilus assembly protein PilN